MPHKKELGQNFLICDEVVDELINVSNLSNEDIVLEIGAGEGVVTEALAQVARKVISLEFDQDLIPNLNKKFAETENVEIIHTDALKFFDQDLYENYKINKIVASLPYQITSPLLHDLVEAKNTITSSTLLIQKEVADRITELAPNANYMSVFLNTFFEIKFISTIDKECFDPAPQVEGGIVTLKVLKNPPIEEVEIQKYSKFLHHGFLQQRKMLNKRFDKEVLESVGIDSTRRAETITIEEWVKLFRKI